MATKNDMPDSAEKLERVDDDQTRLENLGIEPSNLQRNFNIWSLAFMSFCSSVTWEAISSSMAQALNSGGSTSLVWGYIASATGALLIVLCIAEYASMIPTAGGQYHYVAELAPPKLRSILSWYAGWMTILGWVLCALAGYFASAMQIQAWAILFHPDYVYEGWHTSLIVIGLTTLFTAFAIFEVKRLHQLQFLAMLLHVVGYFATVIYLLVHVHEKNTAKYVFTDTTNLSGWDNAGAAWLIGLLTTAIGFVSWDSPIHMAEEMTNVARDLPRSLLITIISSAVFTFPWVIALAFCITDIGGVLAGPVGTISFMAQMFYNVSGGSQAATIGLTMFLPIMGLCGIGPSIITATSRIVWAFARDGGLPATFANVNDQTKTPVMSLVLSWALVSVLSLIYVGNATAFYGFSSACTVALLISYGFPIAMNVIWGFKHCPLPKGPFSLGKYHKLAAIPALGWCLLMTVTMCFPTYKPVTTENMNYAAVVIFGGLFIATVSWFAYGRNSYIPITQRLEASHDPEN